MIQLFWTILSFHLPPVVNEVVLIICPLAFSTRAPISYTFQFRDITVSSEGICELCVKGLAAMCLDHYIDVIMTTMASQITSLTVVYSTVYSEADQRKHQNSASLAFVWGIHRDRWIPRTKDQLRGKCLHLMTSSWQDYHLSPALHLSFAHTGSA